MSLSKMRLSSGTIICILCTIHLACRSHDGNSCSLDSKSFDGIFRYGGWQLYDVWSLTEQDSTGVCLLEAHNYDFALAYTPLLAVSDEKICNYRVHSLCPDKMDMSDIYKYDGREHRLVLKGCMGAIGYPEEYQVVSLIDEKLMCSAYIDSNMVWGSDNQRIPYKGKALFCFEHKPSSDVQQWKALHEHYKKCLTPKRISADEFKRLSQQGGWMRESVFSIHPNEELGGDWGRMEMCISGNCRYSFDGDSVFCYYYLYPHDPHIYKSRFTYSEDSCYATSDCKFFANERIIYIDDSLMTIRGYKSNRITVYRRHPQTAVEEWKKKWRRGYI